MDLSTRIGEQNVLEITYGAGPEQKTRFSGVVFVELTRLRKTEEVRVGMWCLSQQLALC